MYKKADKILKLSAHTQNLYWYKLLALKKFSVSLDYPFKGCPNVHHVRSNRWRGDEKDGPAFYFYPEIYNIRLLIWSHVGCLWWINYMALQSTSRQFIELSLKGIVSGDFYFKFFHGSSSPGPPSIVFRNLKRYISLIGQLGAQKNMIFGKNWPKNLATQSPPPPPDGFIIQICQDFARDELDLRSFIN